MMIQSIIGMLSRIYNPHLLIYNGYHITVKYCNKSNSIKYIRLNMSLKVLIGQQSGYQIKLIYLIKINTLMRQNNIMSANMFSHCEAAYRTYYF